MLVIWNATPSRTAYGMASSPLKPVMSIAIKPTSSILVPRDSIDVAGAPTEVITKGRHDPCVGIRAAPIMEALLALVVMDHALRHRAQCGDVHVGTPDIAAAGRA